MALEPGRRRFLLALAWAGPSVAGAGLPEPGRPARAVWPPPVTLDYQVRRGLLSGQGRLIWDPRPPRYRLRLEARVALLGTVLTQTSTGTLEDGGLVPERFTDERFRRPLRVADFQRPSGPIVFSGRQDTQPLQPGMQDRLSWMIQLPALVQADPGWQHSGRELGLVVVGARADLDRWVFRSHGQQTVALADGRSLQALHLERLNPASGGTHAEVWLDPARHHLPVRARLVEGRDEPFELVLTGG
ncbi:MAG: hypothetical protein KatS3mg122_2058 [Caldimonas sp.]|uniref:DUF3108 domain-containing protein n=1 Tax=Caldimonas taiwanensis TaxID=307483 RepID=UPI0007845485|nr:DUF3108 domain-containing protein [Caldimonas taiwanensis]GIX24827.1 MAG: hypothetical protein KatS3mg122_2058 [Caldimonas sp.]